MWLIVKTLGSVHSTERKKEKKRSEVDERRRGKPEVDEEKAI